MTVKINPNNHNQPFFLRTKLIILFAPLAVMLLFFILYVKFPDIYLGIVMEDSLIEYTQASFYLVASVIGLLTVRQLRDAGQKFKVIIVLAFSMGSFFIFGEEISWGQRLIGFHTPEALKQINTQHEFTGHNLIFIQPYTRQAYYVICSYACLSWIIPMFAKLERQHFLRYISPGWESITLFAPIALFYFFHHLYFELNNIAISDRYIIWPHVESWRHQETFELFFAFGFVIVALRNYLLSKTEFANNIKPTLP